MKLDKKISIVLFALAIIIIAIALLLILKRNFKTIIFNNYEISYNADLFNIGFISPLQINNYLNKQEYKSGGFTFKTKDNKYILIYSFSDVELPPSNALNDISIFNKSDKNYKLYNFDKNTLGFNLIRCNNNNDVINCYPVTETYNSKYNYGNELKNGNFYFGERLNLLGLENSNLKIEFYSSNFPTEKELVDILEIHKSILNAKKI